MNFDKSLGIKIRTEKIAYARLYTENRLCWSCSEVDDSVIKSNTLRKGTVLSEDVHTGCDLLALEMHQDEEMTYCGC